MIDPQQQPQPWVGTLKRLVFCGGVMLCAVVSPACQGNDDLCVGAVAMSDQCGMPLTKEECKALSSDDAHKLQAALEEMNCSVGNSNDPPSAETCKLAGWPCPAAIGPDPDTGNAPQYQVVFVSGIDGQAAFDWNPALLGAVAATTGAKVVHATLPSWTSTNERASALWSTLLDHGAGNDGVKFNLICYAVGGLDCRTLASANGLFSSDPDTYRIVQSSIASITTISTPHHGTRVADASVIALETGTQSDLIESVTGLNVPTSIASGALLDSLRAITLDAASRRSATLTDGDGIYYQSFAGVSHVAGDASAPSAASVNAACVDSAGNISITGGADLVDVMQPQLWITAPLGGASEDDSGNVSVSPTDGMVAVESAKWGTFRGCIPADHYHVIGQLHRSSRDVMTGFDVGRFYSWLVGDLAGRGF